MQAPHESLPEGETGKLSAFFSSLADLEGVRGGGHTQQSLEVTQVGDGTRGPRFKSWLLHFQARRI